jgi:hypothetical protein
VLGSADLGISSWLKKELLATAVISGLESVKSRGWLQPLRNKHSGTDLRAAAQVLRNSPMKASPVRPVPIGRIGREYSAALA